MVAAIAVTTATVMPVFLVSGLVVQIGAELGFTAAGLGLAVAAYFGTSALTSVPSGWLVERFGARVTSQAGVLLAVASMLCIGLGARSYATLVAALVIGAGANALGQLATNSALSRHIPAHRQGLSFGLKQAAIPAATLIAGAAVPGVALTVGWRWAFVMAAALALAAMAAAPRGQAGARPRREAGDLDRATAALVVVGTGGAFAAASASCLGIFLVDSAVDQGVGAAAAGLTLAFGSIVGVTARVLAGWLADRRSGGHIAVVAGMLTAGALGPALLAVGSTTTLLLGTAVGYGLGWAWPGLLNFAVVRLHPAAPAAATSITQAGIYVGGFVGPIGFGLLAASGSYPMAWLAAAAGLVIAGSLMMLGRRMLRAHPATRAAAQRHRAAAMPPGAG